MCCYAEVKSCPSTVPLSRNKHLKIFIYKLTFQKQKFFIFIPFTYICGNKLNFLMYEGPGSLDSVDWLQDGWSNPSGGEIFRMCPDRSWGPPSPLYNVYWDFPGGKVRPGRDSDPHPLLVPWSRKSRAIPLLPQWAVQAVQSLSACTVQQYLYCPYWPYGLYRASVPVQYSYTSTPPIGRTACTQPQCLYSSAIPPLPLLAVRPVQSLSACTVQLYLYSPYGPYGLCRASLPVQRCTLPLSYNSIQHFSKFNP